MKLVATYNLGGVWYAEHTIPAMRRYAQRIGADFIEFARFGSEEWNGFPPSWMHADAIRHLARQRRYRSMLLLDADVYVMPSCPDLFELAGDRFGVVADMGMPTMGEAMQRGARFLEGRPVDRPYFNAGVMVVPAEAARRIEGALRPPAPPHPCFDQHFLNGLIAGGDDVLWLPHRFNWLAPQFVEAALQQCLVHFVGEHKSALPAFAARVAERFPVGSVEGSSDGFASLSDCAHGLRTDKGTDHSYLAFYEQALATKRTSKIRLLEIGVGEGGSLRMWRRYFPLAELHGLDVRSISLPDLDCALHAFSQTDRDAIDRTWADDSLDVVIDDGSHCTEDQLLALCYFWPKLKRGGLYFVEDVVDAERLKFFEAFRPLRLDRSSLRGRRDDVLVVLQK